MQAANSLEFTHKIGGFSFGRFQDFSREVAKREVGVLEACDSKVVGKFGTTEGWTCPRIACAGLRVGLMV